MFGLDLATLLMLSMAISGILYFVVAAYKRLAIYWWAAGGIAICIPIAMVIPSIKSFMQSSRSLRGLADEEFIFLFIYALIYIGLWIFVKQEEISEEIRARQEKMDTIIFDGFFALKEKRINDAYYIFKKGYLIDPSNPVIKTILASFHQGKHGMVKENTIIEWKYKILLALKGKKYHPHLITQPNEANGQNDETEVKQVEGKIVE